MTHFLLRYQPYGKIDLADGIFCQVEKIDLTRWKIIFAGGKITLN